MASSGLPSGAFLTTLPTVNQTPGGTPFGAQLVDLGAPTRADADATAFASPFVCDTTRPAPATTTVP